MASSFLKKMDGCVESCYTQLSECMFNNSENHHIIEPNLSISGSQQIPNAWISQNLLRKSMDPIENRLRTHSSNTFTAKL